MAVVVVVEVKRKKWFDYDFDKQSHMQSSTA